MKRKTKNIIIGMIFLALLVTAFLVFGLNKPFAVSGSSTLSISQANLQSSNPYLNGKAWLLTFSAGGLGQSYYGTITPSDIDSQTPDSTRTTKNLKIRIDYDDESCQYPISNTAQLTPIYDVEKYSYTYIPFISNCDFSTASEKPGISASNIFIVAKPSGSFTCYVIYNTGKSPIGSMGNGNVHAPYTITLDVEGKTASKQIDPASGSTQGPIGDYAYAIWNGNLVSGISCPATYDYRASYVNGNWRIIDKQKYDLYVNKYNQMPQLSFASGNSVIENWVSDIKYYANQAKVSTNFGTIDSSSSLTSAIAKVPLNSPLQFPVTTLYVKADTLGVYTPVPKIGITSTSSNCFKTGENGMISVNIKNTGDEAGTYNLFATCNNPFQITQSSTGSLKSGESRTVNLPLSATASQKTQSTCSVSVETTGGTKTATTNVCVDPQITCIIPYPQKFCGFSGNQEVVFQCSENGATRNLIQNCASNEYCDKGICISSGTSGGKNLFDSIGDFFNNLFGGVINTFKIIGWILVLIGTLFSLFFVKGLLSRFLDENKKENKIAIWIISSLVGIGVGILLFTLLFSIIFWIILALIIVLVIVLKFVPISNFSKIIKRIK